jgi:radical SAM superfamily enzyme YgiQ (UPF0313 family)
MTDGAVAALLGPDEQENLSLRYLAAAAEAAGQRVRLVPFNRRADAERAVAEVLALSPLLAGISIPFQYAVEDSLNLARVLRGRGFAGHITCGGQVPTFCAEELLAACPEIDTVVRHEGERTLVELIEAIAGGRSPGGIAGLVRREGSAIVREQPRLPEPDLDALSWPVRPATLMHVAGVPIAFVLTGRGCVANCRYCCVRALGRDAGGPAFRVRHPDAVAGEIAALYHGRGVRLFFVQDDLFIQPSARRTLARLAALRESLLARGVTDGAFWIKSRPESISEPVARAARDLGALHIFLGVENASAPRLAYLGRRHSPEQNRRAIALCLDHGIRPSFNLMLFDPESALDDVAMNIDFAEEFIDLQWNICRTELYSGTPLLHLMQAEGRARGDFRGYDYATRDPRAELMFRVIRVALLERCLAHDSLMNRMIALSFGRQVHERFFPGRTTADLARLCDGLIVEVHRDTALALRRALEFSRTADLGDASAATRFAVDLGLELGRRAGPWQERFRRLWKRLGARGATLQRRSKQPVPENRRRRC